MTSEKNFERMLAHAGWGDPIGGLWFVGIEEGSGWNGSSDAVEQWFNERREAIRALAEMTYETGVGCEGLPAASRSKVRYWEQAIVDRIRRSATGDPSSAVPSIWSPGSRVFHANLYPLARRTVAEWPEYFNSLFGLSNRESYQQVVEKVRFEKLRETRLAAGAQATVCFGKSYWGDFERAFSLDPASAVPEARGKLKRYDDARVICAPFFGYWHMKTSLADAIADCLSEWGVDLGY